MTNNLYGRILGVLQKIWQQCYHFRKLVFNFGAVQYGLLGGSVFMGWYTMGWREINHLLQAQITINNAFNGAMDGAVSSSTILDVLNHANYYFPLDTLGTLVLNYTALWSGVHAVKGAKELAKCIDTFRGIVK